MKRIVLVTLGICLLAGSTWAQEPAPAQPLAQRGGGRGGRGGQQAPPVISPDVFPDRKIAFRIYAPQAQAVRLTASDIPGLGQTATLTKAANGVWETTVGPVEPGAYRYNFSVDGVATIDPRSPSISEANANVWSMVYVPGADFMDAKNNVPHGAVAAVPYFSTALNAWRRLHVYTPPGYETGDDKYPVFYLLHGAGDNDHSWSSVGRANFILDNLIAAKKAKPMVVVMTAGHTPPTPNAGQGRGGGGGFLAAADPFAQEFVTDVMPLVEKRYRVLTDRAHTAIAGLSMGGSQTLNIAIPNLKRFAYIGVYSSGLIGEAGGGGGRGGRGGDAPAATAVPATPNPNSWESRNVAMLDNAALKKGLKLVWFSTGKDDTLIGTTKATVDVLKKHGFTVAFEESPGGHTWINWRNYLNTFAPQLFQ